MYHQSNKTMMKFEYGMDNCRVCFAQTKSSRPLNEKFEDDEETPIEMMEKVAGLNIILEKNPEIPQKICKGCYLSLNLAFQFRLRVLSAEHIIDMHLKKQQRDLTVENTIYGNEQSFEKLNIDTKDNSDVSNIQENNAFQGEELVVNYNEITKSIEYQQVDELEDCMVNEEYLDFEFELMIDYDVDDDLNTIDEKEEAVNINESKKENITIFKLNALSEPMCPKTKKRREKQSSKKIKQGLTINIPNSTPEKIKNEKVDNYYTNTKLYICDICGNAFEKRARLMEHRRRHTKELTFACEICDERFHLRENMRRHMFTHRGDRPYKCSYCSRSFYYESVKKSHEL